jgi:hypothetical protein
MMDYLSLVVGIVALLVLLWALLRIGLLTKPDYENDEPATHRDTEPMPLSDAEIVNREYARRPHVRAISEPKGVEDRWTKVL